MMSYTMTESSRKQMIRQKLVIMATYDLTQDELKKVTRQDYMIMLTATGGSLVPVYPVPDVHRLR